MVVAARHDFAAHLCNRVRLGWCFACLFRVAVTPATYAHDQGIQLGAGACGVNHSRQALNARNTAGHMYTRTTQRVLLLSNMLSCSQTLCKTFVQPALKLAPNIPVGQHGIAHRPEKACLTHRTTPRVWLMRAVSTPWVVGRRVQVAQQSAISTRKTTNDTHVSQCVTASKQEGGIDSATWCDQTKMALQHKYCGHRLAVERPP